MVKVYHAKFRDAASGEMRVSPYKGTVEWASRLHGVIIPDWPRTLPNAISEARASMFYRPLV